jgi:hypothetical protein
MASNGAATGATSAIGAATGVSLWILFLNHFKYEIKIIIKIKAMMTANCRQRTSYMSQASKTYCRGRARRIGKQKKTDESWVGTSAKK